MHHWCRGSRTAAAGRRRRRRRVRWSQSGGCMCLTPASRRACLRMVLLGVRFGRLWNQSHTWASGRSCHSLLLSDIRHCTWSLNPRSVSRSGAYQKWLENKKGFSHTSARDSMIRWPLRFRRRARAEPCSSLALLDREIPTALGAGRHRASDAGHQQEIRRVLWQAWRRATRLTLES